jgi:acyl carrier protein
MSVFVKWNSRRRPPEKSNDTVWKRRYKPMLSIITNLIMEYVEVKEEDLTPDVNPVRDLCLNSYDFISIIGRLESELGIEIDEREIRNLETLGELDAYVKSKMIQ